MFKQIGNIRKNSKQILGLNERYLSYIRLSNKRSAIEIADDKVKTKTILKTKGIPTPDLITLIESYSDIDTFDFSTLPKSFVLKPARGTKGGGIEIFYNKFNNEEWIRADGTKASIDYLKNHMRDIVDGRFSLHNEKDMVMIEERVRPHKDFRYHTFKGTPDIRVIVYNNIPVMAMLRLPTEKSKGKANLDMGAIGAGIDMAAGKTTYSVSGKIGNIEKIPHTKLQISGLRIPYWNKILEYSVQASIVTNLGFVGVDLLIDKELGPMIVELNARPGLSIQFANKDGLRRRLRKASGINVTSVEKGVRLAKDMFGGEIEKNIERISGKEVIGLYETIKVFKKNKKDTFINIKAKIDTGATITSIDEELAYELGFKEAIIFSKEILKDLPKTFTNADDLKILAKQQGLEEKLTKHPDIVDTAIIKQSNGISYRITVAVNLEISGITIESRANIVPRGNLTYKVLVGNRDLKKFLIEPGN